MRKLNAVILTFLTAAACTKAQDPVTPLLKQLDDTKRDVRGKALMDLIELGPNAAPATDRLIVILKGFDEEERTLATIALGNIGKPALASLVKLLDHEDEAVRFNAVWALGLMRSDAKAHVPRLLKLAERDPDADVRAKAVFALTRIAPTDAWPVLANLAADPKTPQELQLLILEESRHCGEAAIDTLGRALQQERTYPIAQQSLAHLLAQHKTKSAAEAMRPFVELAFAKVSAPPSTPWLLWRAVLSKSDLSDGAGMTSSLRRAPRMCSHPSKNACTARTPANAWPLASCSAGWGARSVPMVMCRSSSSGS